MKPLTKNVRPGDLFYIPAMTNEGTFGFVIGRYIELVPTNLGYLIEVFAKFYTEPPKLIEEVDKSQRLFRPIMCSLRFAENPKWKILFSDPHYDKGHSDFDNIAIAFHDELWIGGKDKPLPSGQLKEFEPSICWRMHHIVFRVNAHLAGIFGPDDCYDYHRLPKEERVDDPAAKAKVIVLAEAMDERFKIWADEAKMRKGR